MATESVPGTELSVMLSPPLSEWLDERAVALDIEKETLLVQLLGAFKAAKDIENDDLGALLSAADLGEVVSSEGIDRAELDELEEDMDELDDALSEHVEDLRSRILQLKDAVESRAPADHDHIEFEKVSEQTAAFSSDFENLQIELETVATELEEISSAFEATDNRLETAEERLDRIARVVLGIRKNMGDTATGDLEALRQLANRNGTTKADCGECGNQIHIGLLSEAVCPHCEQKFDDIEQPTSFLGRFKTPKLVRSAEVSHESELDDE